MKVGLVLVALAAGGALVSSRPDPPERPTGRQNVVMILVDTLRADHTSLYGYRRPTTPFLEKFAAQGTVFRQARSQASCTFPSVNSILSGRHPAIYLGQPDGKQGFLEGVPTLQGLLRQAGYRTIAVSSSTVVRKNPGPHNLGGGFDPGFDVFDESCLFKRAPCVSERSLRLVEGGSAPFFLYAHYLDPHSPYDPPGPFERRFTRRENQVRKFVRRGDLGPVRSFLREGGKPVELTEVEKRHAVALYDEDVLTVDDGIRRLVEGLAERGLLRNTLVVVLSDHGEEHFDHGGIYHCSTTYDELVRTPLVIVGPGVGPGVVHSAVQNLDVLPTILEWVDLPLPSEPLEGTSRAALLRRPRRSSGGLASDQIGTLAFSAQHVWRSVTDGRFKLVLDLENRGARLFDLAADPGEREDVATLNRPEFRRLHTALVAHLVATEGGVGDERSMKAMDESLRQLKALGYL